MGAPTDRDLIQHARRGDSAAFGELVTRYQTSVFNVCYRILHERSDAEDMFRAYSWRSWGGGHRGHVKNIYKFLRRMGGQGKFFHYNYRVPQNRPNSTFEAQPTILLNMCDNLRDKR